MISLRENISVALAAILANKMRSALTMLGIIIGISAVITIVSIGSGQGKLMQDKMNNQGFANITINASQTEGTEKSDDKPIVIDMALLGEVCNNHKDDIDGVSLDINMSDINEDWINDYVKTKRGSSEVYLKFTSEAFWITSKFTFLAGAPLTTSDFRNGSQSIILTESQAKKLFGSVSEECIGKTVDCYFLNIYSTFTVKGVIKQPMDIYASNYYDDPLTGAFKTAPFSYIPYKCYEKMTGKKYDFTSVTVIPRKGSSSDQILSLLSALESELSAKAPEYLTYKTTSMVDFIKETGESSRNQFLVTALVAAIALLVGGIGVMNIMMVSITERTREIGTRKALGATNSSLLFQFITEAILLCLIGGIIGIILGIIFGVIACNIMKVPYVLEPLSIIVSVVFSLLIGGFFGYYPASRAARMDPIEALRYE